MTSPRALTLLTLLVAGVAAGGSEPARAQDSPEAVLRLFVGTWRTEAVIRSSGPPTRELRTTGRATGRLLVDGWVEFRSTSLDPPGVTAIQLMTYAAEWRLFRQWV